MANFAIIGAGFSGTLLALHLLRRTPDYVRVVLIERQNRFAQGPAYATGNPSHLLNVPAGRMSAFHDRPGDFLDWLARQPDAPAGLGPGSFAPRRHFGAYIRQLLHEELKRPGAAQRLELVRGDVVAIETEPHGPLSLSIGTERRIAADLAVLAIGNFPPEPPAIANPGFYDTPFYRPDPWAADALDGLDPDAAVLLIGTGLTMVDTVTSLEDAGHRGPIHALSRRGLTPLCHAGPAAPPRRPGAAIPDRLIDCLKMLRNEARRAAREGSTWQAALDDLRPFGRDLWQNFPAADRSRFLRHLRPWWDVHRHRLAPAVSTDRDCARPRPTRDPCRPNRAHRCRPRHGDRDLSPARHRRPVHDRCRSRRQLRRSGLRFRSHPPSAGAPPAGRRHGPARSAPAGPGRGAVRRAQGPRRRYLAPIVRRRPGHPRRLLGNDRGARHPPPMRTAGGAIGDAGVAT
jgi:uncharacterized NAD(P)/FAD-binding protein YdhS